MSEPIKPRRNMWNPKKPRPGEVIGGGFFVARRGDSTGRVRASNYPYEHDTLESAEEQARNLARLMPGEVFTVWQQVVGPIVVAPAQDSEAA